MSNARSPAHARQHQGRCPAAAKGGPIPTVHTEPLRATCVANQLMLDLKSRIPFLRCVIMTLTLMGIRCANFLLLQRAFLFLRQQQSTFRTLRRNGDVMQKISPKVGGLLWAGQQGKSCGVSDPQLQGSKSNRNQLLRDWLRFRHQCGSRHGPKMEAADPGEGAVRRRF